MPTRTVSFNSPGLNRPRSVVRGLLGRSAGVAAVALAAAVCSIGLLGLMAEPASAQSTSNTAPPLTAPTVPPSATVPRASSPSPRRRAPKVTKRRVTAKAKAKAKTKPTTEPTTKSGSEGSDTAPTPASTEKIKRATVVGSGSTGLAVREMAKIDGKLLSRKPEGTIMRIACEVQGDSVKDNVSSRASTVWIKLVSGGYVSSIYTSAFEAGEVGSGDRKLVACNADGSVPSTIPVAPATTKKPSGGTATTEPAKGVVSAKGAVSTVDPG
jgi:hypothetical protein